MIKNFNANKAYGWNDISIQKIQLCGRSIALHLKWLLLKFAIHIKESKSLMKNYQPIIFLPIFFLEGPVFNSFLLILYKINPITECQSGFTQEILALLNFLFISYF